MNITEANDEEISVVTNLIHQAFQEYAGVLHPPSGALSETVEGIKNRINGRGGAIIVRDDESVPVGTAIYYFEQDYMYIGRVSVIPAHRGLGIGLSILAFLEEKARRKGCFKTRVGVRLSLPENIEWYSRLGYVPVEEREYPDQTDRWYVMIKELA